MGAPEWATHKGWFGICPVYVAGLDDEGPTVEPRWWFVAWLMPMSEAIFGVCFSIASALNPDYEPAWPIRITGAVR